jgi:hypothetical protein
MVPCFLGSCCIHACMQCPSCVFPATEGARATLAALARGMQRTNKVALVRYVLAANRPMSLGVLTPRVLEPSASALGVDRCPDHFLLNKIAWGSDYHKLTLKKIEAVVVRTPHLLHRIALLFRPRRNLFTFSELSGRLKQKTLIRTKLNQHFDIG